MKRIEQWCYKREHGDVLAKPGRGKWREVLLYDVPLAVREFVAEAGRNERDWEDACRANRPFVKIHKARQGVAHRFVVTAWLDLGNPGANGTMIDLPTSLPSWPHFRAACNRDKMTGMVDLDDFHHFVLLLRMAAERAIACESFYETAWCRDVPPRHYYNTPQPNRAGYGVCLDTQTVTPMWEFGRCRPRPGFDPGKPTPFNHPSRRDSDAYRRQWSYDHRDPADPLAMAGVQLRAAAWLAKIERMLR